MIFHKRLFYFALSKQIFSRSASKLYRKEYLDGIYRRHTNVLNICTDINDSIKCIPLNVRLDYNIISTHLSCPSSPFAILKSVATATLTSRDGRLCFLDT